MTSAPATSVRRHEAVALIRERKYAVTLHDLPLVSEYLDHACLEDPHYPENIVESIYFDTPDLRSYAEKENGDYLKTKVRLRRYLASDGATPGADGERFWFLEIKSRHGAARSKVRLPLQASDPREVADAAAGDGGIAELLAGLGHRRHGPLLPSVVVRYRRHRYVEPLSGARIALDRDISAPWVNDRLITAEPPVRLWLAVLEIKGDPASPQLPPTMGPIRQCLFCEAFSKYARCLELLSGTCRR